MRAGLTRRAEVRASIGESVAGPDSAVQNGAVLQISDAEFDDLVADALDLLPDKLAEVLNNVVVVVEADPPPGEEHLLGVYDGIPLTERDRWYTGVLPDRISIFRQPLLRMCSSAEEVVEQVRITVLHEIAHHFGISDERLEELGYD
jgi:predicted Zn-dependent protease with MMP-like domain